MSGDDIWREPEGRCLACLIALAIGSEADARRSARSRLVRLLLCEEELLGKGASF